MDAQYRLEMPTCPRVTKMELTRPNFIIYLPYTRTFTKLHVLKISTVRLVLGDISHMVSSYVVLTVAVARQDQYQPCHQ